MALVCRTFSRSWKACNLATVPLARAVHSSPQTHAPAPDKSYRFVVCGAGAGGLAIGSTLGRKYGPGKLAIIDPSEVSVLL